MSSYPARRKRFPVRLTLAVLMIFVAGIVFAAGTAESEDTITVVGVGELVLAPDQAVINVGIQLYDESALAASQALDDAVARLIAAVRDLGVAEEDIQTTSYNLFFERDFQAPQSAAGQPAGIYRVENIVRVTVRDIDRAPTVIETAMGAGANLMYGVEFSLSNDPEREAELQRLALENALTRAESIASLLGRSVGEVVEVREGGGNAAPFGTRIATEAALAPIQGGTLRYTSTVEVRYRLR